MATIERRTKETQVAVSLEYPADPAVENRINVPSGFLGHMLELLAHRAGLHMEIEAAGDMHVDAHHVTEDAGIVLGSALREMLRRDPTTRRRYGWCLLPMDGSLVQVALDLSGRGGLYWEGSFPTDRCGDFDLELTPEFFRGFCRESAATMHIRILAADNSHHASEAVFKGVGLALGMALSPSEIQPSTKGEWL